MCSLASERLFVPLQKQGGENMRKVMSIVGAVLLVVSAFVWLAPIMAGGKMSGEAALGWLFLTPMLATFGFVGLILLIVGLVTGKGD